MGDLPTHQVSSQSIKRFRSGGRSKLRTDKKHRRRDTFNILFKENNKKKPHKPKHSRLCFAQLTTRSFFSKGSKSHTFHVSYDARTSPYCRSLPCPRHSGKQKWTCRSSDTLQTSAIKKAQMASLGIMEIWHLESFRLEKQQ